MMAATPSLALDLCKEINEKYSVNLVESTKFSLINRNQCMILFRKLLDTQETLVTIQHKLSDSEFTSSQSSDVGPVIHGLIHVLKRVHVIFFKDCFCKDKWLKTALRQGGDLKETFAEIVSDLQWYRSVLHRIVFKQVGQHSQDVAPVDCDRNLSEIDLEALSAAAKSDQEDLKGFLRELKGEPAGCGEKGGYISMQCLATQLLDKLEFQPWSSTALEKYDEGLHEGGRNKWSEWPLVLSVNMQDLRKGPLLGEGSFGSVHETDWLGETYAMKIPKHGHCTQFLELEIKALAGLQHPHVIRLVGCAEEEGKHLYLMERMDKSLSKMLEDCPLPLVQRVDMMLQIAEGVRYLHSKNIVHRDLKPENILVKRDDSGPESLMLAPPVEHFWIAKVSDFGSAKGKMESMAYAGQTTNVGTTMFMAPEMYELENGADQPERFHPMKTDVYSFALICFVVLTSESTPFPFKDLMNPTVKAFKDRVRKGKRPELPPNCPVYLSDLMQQCWDGNPVKRPNFNYICTELRHIKDFLLTGEEEGIESLLKKSQMWADGSDSLGTLDFHNSAMESPWMQPSQQRMDSAVASILGQHPNSQAPVRHESMGGQAAERFSNPEGYVPLPRGHEQDSHLDRFYAGPHLPNLTERPNFSSTAGAAQAEYMITADDCDSKLAVNCVPMDEKGRRGELVMVMANDSRPISQDPMMKDQIVSYIANGYASFDGQFLEGPSEEPLEPAVLILRRSTYELRRNDSRKVISEKYAADVSIEIPVGPLIQCVIQSHDGRRSSFALGDARRRDATVLTFRAFLKTAVDEIKKKKHKWLHH